MSDGRLPRVYWITEEFFPPEVGGTGFVASILSQGLSKRSVPMQVITRQTEPPSEARELIGAVHVRRIKPAGRMKGKGWRAIPAMLEYLAKIASLLIRERRSYDVVIISCMKIIPLVAVPICRMLGKRTVVRLESPFELVQPIAAESFGAAGNMTRGLAGGALGGLQRRILRGASRVVAISQDIEGLLAGLAFPPARIARIPNAIDLSRFAPVSAEARARLRARLQLPADRTIVVYAGRVTQAKGVAMLVEGWPELVARHPDLYLVIVGTGKGSWDDCEAQVAEYIRSHSLEGHVALVGHSDSVQDYLQAADLFVSPSDYEGFGLSVVEALACGLPIVTTSVGVAEQIVHDGINGFVCAPKQQQQLFAAFERAMSARGRWQEIGQQARVSVGIFDVERVVDQYVALCIELKAGRA
jgi:glycosyltransferase involved in cell wall biosynthesis